jgi:hypothetical protein
VVDVLSNIEGALLTMLRDLTILLATGLLMGCAHWDKPGATSADFHAADDACLTAAYEHTPLQSCTGDPLNPNCYTAAGNYSPALAGVVDEGATGREAAYEACMSAKGWTKQDSQGIAMGPPIFNVPSR